MLSRALSCSLIQVLGLSNSSPNAARAQSLSESSYGNPTHSTPLGSTSLLRGGAGAAGGVGAGAAGGVGAGVPHGQLNEHLGRTSSISSLRTSRPYGGGAFSCDDDSSNQQRQLSLPTVSRRAGRSKKSSGSSRKRSSEKTELEKGKGKGGQKRGAK
jgi:hypothetical protein